MTRRGLAAAAAAAVLVCAATSAAGARPASPVAPAVSGQAGSTRLLDVPFLPQTEDLCGGAAVAMVLRYWGERLIYPDDFAALVDRSSAGIHTDVLAADVRRRGWQAFVIDTARDAPAVMASHVERGRPVVALIEVRPNRYHYVVIVAWTGHDVVVHDPARAPFRVMAQPDFDRAWAAAGRWAMLVVPGAGRTSALSAPWEPPALDPAASRSCAPLISSLVAQARAGDVAGAEHGLLAVGRLCRDDPAVWRELAGIRFLQARWPEASALAERAAALDPRDVDGMDLLATSRFLNHEPDQALGAWNRIGRPSVDVVRVTGVRRTRHPVVVAAVGLPPRTLLTPDAYGRAERRLQELPSAAVTRLRYQPLEGGLAEIEATVVERSTVPRGVLPLGAMALRMAVQHELRLEVAAPTGSGELWTVAWRRWDPGPRLAFTLAVPSVGWLPGVTTIEGLWQRSAYAPGSAGAADGAVVTNVRQRTSVGLADWASSRLRWHASLSLDRWGAERHASVAGGLDRYFARDRVAVGVAASTWTPGPSGRAFVATGATLAVRSTRESARPVWMLSGGLASATSGAPLDVWPGAGTGYVRLPLLRAHPLLHAGVVGGSAFGRRLAHTTVEYQHPLPKLPAGVIRIAAFADTARAWARPSAAPGRSWQTDVGAGVRVALPGRGGMLRVDVARGLRDGGVIVSAGWLPPWPGR
ncbi:MAG TPA: C39 family peptidase [Vicinamibacterales bacterium]|nr:C39 family peptidase [Vicinamibacterales bacterium]